MKRTSTYLVISFLYLLSSCGPANYGNIIYRPEGNCSRYAVLENTSSDKQITFVIEQTLLLNDKPETYITEETLSPKSERNLGCLEDNFDANYNWKFTNKAYKIVGARATSGL